MNRHEIIDAPAVRRDPRSGEEFREVLIAAWQQSDKRRTPNTITRRINGTRLRADLFSRLKVFYQPVGNRIKEYDTRLGPAWHDLTTRTMVLVSEAAIEPEAVAAQRNWEREQFARDMAAEIGGCVDRFMNRAENKNYVGDRRHTTLNLQVASGDDDATETADGAVFQGTGNTIYLRANATSSIRRNSGFHFPSVAIPQGATIDACDATLKTQGFDDPAVDMHFEDSDTTSNFVVVADVTSRVPTTAFESWIADNLGSDTLVTSPDFASALQEVINRPGWSSGNNLTALFRGRSDLSKNCYVDSYESDSANAAKLDIDYTSITPPTVTSVTPDSGTTAGGTTVVIVGTGFAAGASVDFDEDAATSVSVDDPETITCDTPAHVAGEVDVTVTNTDTGTDTLSEGYEYVEPAQAVGIAAETDTALGITPAKSRAIGIAAETDTALPAAAAKSRAIGIADVTELALPLAAAKSRAIGIAVETDTALPLAAAKSQAIGIATETDTALPAAAAKSRAIGIAVETDTALPVAPSNAIAIGLAAETDTALSIAAAKSRVIGIAAEAGTALPLSPAKSRAIGIASETDTALAGASAKSRTLGIAAETDLALPLAAAKSRAIGIASETDTALRISTVPSAGPPFRLGGSASYQAGATVAAGYCPHSVGSAYAAG